MEKINKQYDKLQDKYGSKQLNSVYGAGCRQNAKVALVFMNPTKRNIATDKNWKGLKAQWLGTKQIWDFLTKCDLFDENLNKQIKSKRPTDWTEEFCEKVYAEVASRGVWITNLAKCSQDDARPLPDEIFLQYRDLLKDELALVSPKKVLLFGNQVASIVLEEKVSVSCARCKKFDLDLNGNVVEGYAVFYPVGNGRFNQDKAICDIKTILKD
ncbi:MAG: hypothetical protein IJX00_02195 [Clostridia bacterium]|nr:hypothetical protein [Clostridia bacterium]